MHPFNRTVLDVNNNVTWSSLTHIIWVNEHIGWLLISILVIGFTCERLILHRSNIECYSTQLVSMYTISTINQIRHIGPISNEHNLHVIYRNKAKNESLMSLNDLYVRLIAYLFIGLILSVIPRINWCVYIHIININPAFGLYSLWTNFMCNI